MKVQNKLSQKILTQIFMMVVCLTTRTNVANAKTPIRIDTLEYITLNGAKQAVLITGNNAAKPSLLFVHGGPGYSEMALVRKYNKDLDNSFIVVNWDQRGTNLSYDPALPESKFSAEQIIADGHQLVQILKKQFHKNKIFLLGHSYGSMIATNMAQQHPDDFYAYIGVGQVANIIDNEKVSYQFALKNAEKEDNQKAIRELRSIMPYPSPTSTLKDLYVSKRWMNYYGGEVYGRQGTDEMFKGIDDGKSPLYDLKKSSAGLEASMQKLWAPFMKTDLPRTALTFKIPVYFLSGRHDYNVPFILADAYFRKIKAPAKTLIYFEHSAHMMPFEEPQRFNEVMAKIAAAIAPKSN